jgi:hypothetical protein
MFSDIDYYTIFGRIQAPVNLMLDISVSLSGSRMYRRIEPLR